ncbi:amino acid racemase [Candidatus Aminicenantes bacterium AC-334-K16]|jgi:aspartate racemase|nr:amino acid racemase [Candidatus Aminicenantes bacterium AC-334-K16]
MKKTIGILGGMGPEASAYMFQLIINQTKVSKDQDHPPCVLLSLPQIPPRTEAILGKGPSPVPLMIEGTKRLQAAGADFIIMPCITAHYFLDEVIPNSPLPFINLLVECSRWVQAHLPHVITLGLVASTGTVISRLFHQTMEKIGKTVLHPTSEEQEKVMTAIFGPGGIKAGTTTGKPKEIIVSIANSLIARGAEAIIAGCTEVPLVLFPSDISVPLVEPMKIGARKAIIEAGCETK